MSSTFKCHGCGCAASQVVTVCDSCASKLEGSAPSASTNTRMDEIAFLESCLQFMKGPSVLFREDDALFIRISDRIAQLRHA